MLVPGAGIKGVKELVVETVKQAGGKECPPLVIGVGIGVNFETCALMAKEALFSNYTDINPNSKLAQYEKDIKDVLNRTDIGPMGLGGNTTCLGVNMKVAPTHIASLPVGINIQCHISRHKEFKIWGK